VVALPRDGKQKFHSPRLRKPCAPSLNETRMSLSRRRLLSVLPASFLLAACSWPATRSTVNVRDYGAVGDGIADDSKAIRDAVAALKRGSTLQFPTGTYRFAELNPPSAAAILITGMSDVTIDFSAGAELVMDNLDRGNGTSHGILIRGPASGISLRNIKIRWRTQPARRSMGDGIRILGYPADTSTPPAGWTGSGGPVNNINVVNCEILSSPQAGVFMTGVSGINIAGLRVQDTMADGLHFNACRRAKIDNHTAINTGDDGLALVTYYSDASSFDNAAQTFSFPNLTDWSGADFTITNVIVAGGMANGVRLAGANRVTISGLIVAGLQSGSAVIADSAAPGLDSRWQYIASRGIRLDSLRVDDCETGVQLLARPNDTVDPRFTEFELEVSDATIRGCTNWAARAESLTTQRTSGFRLSSCSVEASSTTGGNGGVGLGNTQDVKMGLVTIRHARPVIAFAAKNAGNFLVDRLQVRITDSEQSEPTRPPCVSIQDSDGAINAMDVGWPQAPASWKPIQVTSDSVGCSEQSVASPVVVRELTVEPSSIGSSVSSC
jgi:hypothetical protein